MSDSCYCVFDQLLKLNPGMQFEEVREFVDIVAVVKLAEDGKSERIIDELWFNKIDDRLT